MPSRIVSVDTPGSAAASKVKRAIERPGPKRIREIYRTSPVVARIPACPRGSCLVPIAERVAKPNCALWHGVAAELVGEAGYVVQIKLRANEQMLREK